VTKQERINAAVAHMKKHPTDSIAKVHRIYRLSRDIIRDLRVDRCGFPPNVIRHLNTNGCEKNEPTPLEIRQRCEEIQKTWTPAMRYSRAKWAGCDGYECPEYTLVEEKRTLLWFEQVG